MQIKNHTATQSGIVQAPGTLKKSLNKSTDARPGTGQCFMSRIATGRKRRVFAEEHIAIT